MALTAGIVHVAASSASTAPPPSTNQKSQRAMARIHEPDRARRANRYARNAPITGACRRAARAKS